MSKPFSIKELFVRLRALERRLCSRQSQSPQIATVAAKVINFDDMSYRITIGTRYVDLTQTEFKLFKYLFERKGQVITKQELQRSVLQKIWADLTAILICTLVTLAVN